MPGCVTARRGDSGSLRASLLFSLPDGAGRADGARVVHQCRRGSPDGFVSGKIFEALKAIERQMGRTDGPRWGPRVIDLDILLFGQEVVDREGLKIPHPEMHRRRFVLEPLCELASYEIHPAFGVSARGLLDRLTDPGVVELYATEETGE